MARRAAHPCPEIVAPDIPFTLEDTGAVHLEHTSRSSGCFAAPYSGDPTAVRAIRAHGLGHLRYSPGKPRPKLYNVSPPALLAAEDGRVNLLLQQNSVDLDALPAGPFPEEVDVKNPLLLFELAALAVARLGTGACSDTTHAWIESVVPTDYLRVIDETVDEAGSIYRRGYTFDQTVQVARLLDSLRPRVASKKKSGGKTETAENGPGWGEMTIETPPLSKSVVSRLRERCSRTEGDFPVAMHRYCSDGAIFSATRTRRTCTVLIDCSSSMRWDADLFAATLARCSGATIAIYAGHAGAETGTLRIIAAHGRMVADSAQLRRPGHDNIIDGPALAWLGRQPGPRFWVSDGQVVGAGRKQTPALLAEALHLCRTHAITRVMPDELPKALRSLR